jgi:hypothetical protein
MINCTICRKEFRRKNSRDVAYLIDNRKCVCKLCQPNLSRWDAFGQSELNQLYASLSQSRADLDWVDFLQSDDHLLNEIIEVQRIKKEQESSQLSS